MLCGTEWRIGKGGGAPFPPSPPKVSHGHTSIRVMMESLLHLDLTRLRPTALHGDSIISSSLTPWPPSPCHPPPIHPLSSLHTRTPLPTGHSKLLHAPGRDGLGGWGPTGGRRAQPPPRPSVPGRQAHRAHAGQGTKQRPLAWCSIRPQRSAAADCSPAAPRAAGCQPRECGGPAQGSGRRAWGRRCAQLLVRFAAPCEGRLRSPGCTGMRDPCVRVVVTRHPRNRPKTRERSPWS
jgi:hypothetical protein